MITLAPFTVFGSTAVLVLSIARYRKILRGS
eukprot:SAG11_NODE_32813_length_280_cov_1.922652_1_plen_30_part_10